ncbi:MAG: VOC family protein [Myxococcaceae bacterium]|nr:VOC family protein [Myxococcaceae bacterium]
MIRGLHGLLYSTEPVAARNFIKDKLKLPFTDVGDGWLIFDLPEGDLGVHPVDPGQPGGGHDVSFYCDDIHGTVAELKSRGVTFESEVADHGYGYVTYFTIPGGIRVQLYEPKYQKRTHEPAAPVKARARTAAKKAGTKARKPAKKASRKAAPKKKSAPKSKKRR